MPYNAKCLLLQGIWSCQRQLNSARQRGAQHILKKPWHQEGPWLHLVFASKTHHENDGNYRATICAGITGTPYHPSENGRWQDGGRLPKSYSCGSKTPDLPDTERRNKVLITCHCLAHYVQNTAWKHPRLKGQTATGSSKDARMVTPITCAIPSATAFRCACLGVLIICFSWGRKRTVHTHRYSTFWFNLALLSKAQTPPCLLCCNQAQLWRQNN